MPTKLHWKVCRKCGTECNCDYFEMKAEMQEDFEYYFNHIRKDFIYEIRLYLERFADRDTLITEDVARRKKEKEMQGQNTPTPV